MIAFTTGHYMLQDIYNNAPYLIQNILLNLHSARIHRERYGEKYKQVFNRLLETQEFNLEQIREYQTAQFRKMVSHAYDTVPYYQKLFKSISLTPADIKTLEDAHKIPVLTKALIRENFTDLISSNFKQKQLVQGGTSGTTGTPLKILWDQNTCIYTNAVDWRQKLWAGIKLGDNIAQLLGRPIVSTKRTKRPFWQKDHLHNQLWMSSFHLSDENIVHYIDKLKSYQPYALEGYPSTLYILSEYLNRNNIQLPLKATLSSSETLLPFQRDSIEKAFCCDLYDFYGLAERVVFATECKFHNGKHLNFEYGYTEILNDDGENVPSGQKGYLTSTSLQNFGMPLLRYKTTDITHIKIESCKCGSHMSKIENITTKAEDIVVTPEGKMISASILTHPFKMVNGITKSQIIQEDEANITLNIVTDADYNSTEEKKLLDNLQYRVGPNIKLTVSYVKDIERTKSGKYRWVISKVKKGQLNPDIS